MLLSMQSSNATSGFTPDEQQRQAIEHVHGPMLVIAGAGTDKTTVLTHRIARLIADKHATAGEILALTYTDNATREMRERVQKLLGTACVVQAMTFHAYCNSLLERCGKKFGVLDDKDLWIYLRKRIRDLNLNYFVRAANVSKFLDDLLDFMRRCQDELVGPEKYAEFVAKIERGDLPVPRVAKSKDAAQLSDNEVVGRCREIASVFATVERMLGEENLGTFGHMITRAYDLLRDDPQLLAQERAGARFVLVDEFQDANFAQVKILGLLAGTDRNIFAVGDPDQAIYRFRGASSAAFGLFQRQFPNAKLVSLQKNQRSLSPILKCAYGVVSKNPPIFAGVPAAAALYRRSPLQPVRTKPASANGREIPAEPVEAVLWRERDLEAADVVSVIRQRRRELRCSWNSFAIIYRNHAHRDQVVEELSRWNIPFSIENMDVLDTPEVRDLLACLGAVVSARDSASLFRVAALPKFGLSAEKVRAAIKAAGREADLAAVLKDIEGGEKVTATIEAARGEIARSQATARMAMAILIRHFGLNRESAAIQAVLEFVAGWEKKAVTKTGQPAELLEYLEYFREARGSINLTSTADDAVRLMTAHGAKGLEFDHVSILRAISGSFPLAYKEVLFEFPRELRDPDSVAEDEGKQLNDQEERRLFYVAMTRARDSLKIYAKEGTGKKDRTPPGFVREMLGDSTLGRDLRQRSARPMQIDLYAEEEPAALLVPNVSRWLDLPPAFDLNTLSASAVESYERCPLQFKLEREWRIPGEVPAAMQYGASIHRVLRTYYDAIRFGRPKPEEELVQLFLDDLAEARIEDPYQHDLYQSQGVQQLRDFLAAAQRRPQPNVIHTEEKFEVRMGEATVVGRVDRIDEVGCGHVVIVDYKTGKPRSQEDADESLQLSIYAIAARERWGYEADRLVFYNLEDNTAISTTRSGLQLQEAKMKVEDVATKIAAGEFEAKTGFHCTFCAYRNLCPATEKPVYIAPSKKAAKRAN